MRGARICGDQKDAVFSEISLSLQSRESSAQSSGDLCSQMASDRTTSEVGQSRISDAETRVDVPSETCNEVPKNLNALIFGPEFTQRSGRVADCWYDHCLSPLFDADEGSEDQLLGCGLRQEDHGE